MLILKIENNTASYIDSLGTWNSIEKLGKDDLLYLMKTAYDCDVELDSHEDNNITNDAHKIIYTHVFKTISELRTNKSEIETSIRKDFIEAHEKYKDHLIQPAP